jgi:hypothetical protein
VGRAIKHRVPAIGENLVWLMDDAKKSNRDRQPRGEPTRSPGMPDLEFAGESNAIAHHHFIGGGACGGAIEFLISLPVASRWSAEPNPPTTLPGWMVRPPVLGLVRLVVSRRANERGDPNVHCWSRFDGCSFGHGLSHLHGDSASS